jgi:photosystem II stability/assembly factor-like uncharacterized protein
MSIVALKRKTAATVQASLANGQGTFSLNGTHRSQGFVGQTSLSRSLPRTIFRGTAAVGYGGCCGEYRVTPVVSSAVRSTEDSSVVKPSVVNTLGMIETKYAWTKRPSPASTKLSTTQNTHTQQDYIDDLHKNTVASVQSSKDLIEVISNKWESISALYNLQPWVYCSISSTGQYQIVTSYDGYISVSNDFGSTWNIQFIVNGSLLGSAISSNGQYQTIVASHSRIFYSQDYGVNWTNSTSSYVNTDYYWVSCAMSYDGKYQTAVMTDDVLNKYIYISKDYGVTWTIADNPGNPQNNFWTGCAVSATGQYQITVDSENGIYISSDIGQNWTYASNIQDANGCAISADGQYQTVITGGNGIYVSSNYGQDWVQSSNISEILQACAMNAEGNYQIAVGHNYYQFIVESYDYGQTWTQLQDPAFNPNFDYVPGVAVSSDANYRLITTPYGAVYKYHPTTHTVIGKPTTRQPTTNCCIHFNNKNRFDYLLNLTKDITGRGGSIAQDQSTYLAIKSGNCNEICVKDSINNMGTAQRPLPGPPASY